VFIIADIGSNWKNKQDCIDSIREAKVAGADAVKFQLYTLEHLYGAHHKLPPCRKLNPVWLPDFKKECKEYGIELMCTAFSPAMINIVDKYVERHKIASAELKYPDLLEEARDTNKPVYISTGGSTEREIECTLDIFGAKRDLVTLLYCVGAYPAKSTDYNLRMIGYLASKYKVSVGISDHTQGKSLARSALYGATAYEKHYKLDSKLDSPDADHSITPAKFRELVKDIRGYEVDFRPQLCEADFVTKYNRRLVSLGNIAPGGKFRYNINYGAFRSETPSGDYISPFDTYKIEGKICKAYLPAGRAITMKYVTI